MIKIKKGGIVYFEEEIIDRSIINFQDFLIANLSMPISIDKGVIANDLIHMMYDMKDFIYNFHSENYETIRAFFVAGNLKLGVDKINLSKEVSIENGFLNISPVMNFSYLENRELGKKLCDIEIETSDILTSGLYEIETQEEKIISSIVDYKLKSELTLLDLTTCFFEDFPSKMHEVIQI